MDINIFICLVKAIYHNKFLYINVLGVGGWLVHFIQVFSAFLIPVYAWMWPNFMKSDIIKLSGNSPYGQGMSI